MKRMVKELFLGGLNFPIQEFLGRKIWQGIGIFNRWLDLSKFFFLSLIELQEPTVHCRHSSTLDSCPAL